MALHIYLVERKEIVAGTGVLEVFWEIREISFGVECSGDHLFEDSAFVEILAVLNKKTEEIFGADRCISGITWSSWLLGFVALRDGFLHVLHGLGASEDEKCCESAVLEDAFWNANHNFRWSSGHSKKMMTKMKEAKYISKIKFENII